MTDEQLRSIQSEVETAIDYLDDYDMNDGGNRGAPIDALRVLRRIGPVLLGALSDSTTSPEISPDSQAIEQARDVLKATTGLSGEQALVVLEELRRILGVTV